MDIKVDSGDLMTLEDKKDGKTYTYLIKIEGRDIIATNISSPKNIIQIKFFQNAFKTKSSIMVNEKEI